MDCVTSDGISSVVLPVVVAYSEVGFVGCEVAASSLVTEFVGVDAGGDVAVDISTINVSDYVLVLNVNRAMIELRSDRMFVVTQRCTV